MLFAFDYYTIFGIPHAQNFPDSPLVFLGYGGHFAMKKLNDRIYTTVSQTNQFPIKFIANNARSHIPETGKPEKFWKTKELSKKRQIFIIK